MLEAALKYQTQGDEWVKRVFLGGVVVFLGLFLVPLFTLNGYLVEVMRRTMRGTVDRPPEWGDLDLVEATVEGLLVSIIAFGYTLVAMLIAGIPFAAFLGIGIATGNEILGIAGIGIGVLVLLVIFLAFAVVFPVAIANFVRTGDLAAGFDLQLIRQIGTNGEMLMAIVMGIAVGFIAGAINSILGFTIIGYLFVPFIAFVTQSASFYLWGRGFADAYADEYGEPPLEPESDRGSVAGGGVGDSFGTADTTTDDTGWAESDTSDAESGWDDDGTAGWDDDTDSDGWQK